MSLSSTPPSAAIGTLGAAPVSGVFPPPPGVTLRDSTAADVAAIQAIYAHHVLHGTGTFETVPPPVDAMAARRDAVLALGQPWLVAEDAVSGRVLGYAYAGQFRPRAAYAHTVEDSIYIAPDSQGRGLGKALLARLIDRCTGLGRRQMVGVIGDSANSGSIALHAALGFSRAGCLEASGFKFGRWLDTVLMQRPLGPGATTGPEA